MGRETGQAELMVGEGRLVTPLIYAIGRIGSRFFSELRDNKRLMAVKCSQCGVVYMPPRSVCAPCSAMMDEWVEVGTQGVVTTFTEVHYEEPYHPMPSPIIYGIIRLDGSDTGLPHVLGECKLENVSIGMRVEAVFSDERKGNILDIKYFKPV